MPKKYDLPAMPFYVGDWLKCPEVRALPPDYRGLWFDLICFMWESTERGVMVKPNGKPYGDSEIVRMVGLDNQNSGIWLTYLLDNEVCSRRLDGAIFSKRMVKDEELRALRREMGKKGGNPHLLVNHTLNQEVNQNVEDENENETKEVKKNGFGEKQFEMLWDNYPNKDGKKEALRHFKSSVKTDQDWLDIQKALKNYLQSERVSKNFIKNGSTWFNNWRDWVKTPGIKPDKASGPCEALVKMEKWKMEKEIEELNQNKGG